MKANPILTLFLILALPLFAAASAQADCTTLDYVDIGDPDSEAGHAMAGWGPIEPETSGGGFGGIADCRPIYAPEDGDDWATIDLDFGGDPTTCKLFTIHHLDGHAQDTFDIYIDGVLVHSYAGDDLTTEHWYQLALDACFTGVKTVKFVSTAPQWSGWATYGQMCFDILKVESCPTGCGLLDMVDLGDPVSEAGHGLSGWGPIEPATSGGNYGGIDNCRPAWAAEDDNDHASLDLDFGDDPLMSKCLTLRHLEGLGLDAFDLYIHPRSRPAQQRLLFSYPGDDQTDELWLETSLQVHACGLQTLTMVSTASQWSGWSTYGQMCFDIVRVDACPPLRAEVDIGDPESEAGFVMAGWGPVEPETSGGGYGGIDHCRPVWAPEDDNDWASIDFDLGCCTGPRCLEMDHLDGIGQDAFEVWVHPVGDPDAAELVFTYSGDGLTTEVWKTSSVLVEGTGRRTFRFVSTEPQWSGWPTYGQMCFSRLALRDYVPLMDMVTIGDTASEAVHVMAGWGPVEPETSGGTYGGIDRCRPIYAPEDGDDWATVELDFGHCVDGTKCLTMHHLDGLAVDAFDVYIYAPGESRPGTPFWSYAGDAFTDEIWYRTSRAVDFTGMQVVEFVSTELPWSMWDIYGQVCFGDILVEGCNPCEPTPYRYATVGVEPEIPRAPGRIVSIAPNPFNPKTEIALELRADARVELAVFDSRGRKVIRLADGHLRADTYTFAWHGHNAAGRRVASGVYFARLRIDDRYVQVEKVSMIK